MKCSAYLDIETTGLSPSSGEITVVGLYREGFSGNGLIQLIGEEISSSRLSEITRDIKRLYTYNGSRFDLPFIREKLGIDLNECCHHNDLMYSCWERNLYGGLKSVERQLGIERTLQDIDGWVAVQLWHDYRENGNRDSLDRLLRYNAEDVLNLKKLRLLLDL